MVVWNMDNGIRRGLSGSPVEDRRHHKLDAARTLGRLAVVCKQIHDRCSHDT